jgi:LAS superfamily LD-carboxypeptidase LdcB
MHFLVLAGLLAMSEPRAAIGYAHGHKTKIQIVTVGYADVEIHTARAFVEMEAAAEADGVELWIASAFRTNDEQKEFYRAWKEGWGHKAARPGHSNHQSGLALDLGGWGAYAWLEANAKRFGFARTVPDEPWHWEFVRKPTKRSHRHR